MKPSYNTVEELRADVGLVTPMKDLEEVLSRLEAFQHAFVSFDATREITLASLLHAYQEENICQVEFRFSPEFMAEPAGLDWDKMFAAMLEAKAACESLLGPKLRVGFIAIASRNYGLASAMETIKFAERWKSELVGFDLAASETDYPTAEFVPAIQRAKELGLGITVHTGEGVSEQYINQVISLYKPNRLGHATTLINSPELMDRVKELNICVESCPTSNLITNCVPKYPDHPMIPYLKNGVPVCLNTDDPMLFDTDLNLEWLYTMDHMGATEADMASLNENARKHSFIPQ
jgi:adenosine deaminase